MNYVKIVEKNSDYYVKKLLGKGGFAVVFEAESIFVEDKNSYALKVVNFFDQGKKYVDREIEINTILRDTPFVIKFYEHKKLTEKDRLFVLEKADYALDQFVQDESKRMNMRGLSELKAFFIFSQLINGIDNIHNMDIVHRDLKHQNILLLNYQVKICDFTTSKKINKSKPTDQTSVGTPSFNGPEGFNTSLMVNEHFHSVDIYALGIILFYLVYEELPYKVKVNDDNPDFENLIKNINYKHKSGREISNSFKSLFKKLIEIEVKKRIKLKDIRNDGWFKMMQKELCNIYPNTRNPIYNFKECYDKIEKIEKSKK